VEVVAAFQEFAHHISVHRTQIASMHSFIRAVTVHTNPFVMNFDVRFGIFLESPIFHPYPLVDLNHFVVFFFEQRYLVLLV
jgi:hypothetical protein